MNLDLADIKPSVMTAVLFAMYALLVIPLLKYVLTRWNVPGLSPLAAAI